MIRHGMIALGALLTTMAGAAAQTPLERGKYLMETIVACGNCHTQQTPQGPRPGFELAGGLKIDDSPAFVAYASNITPDAETGIGKWTDAQIITAIREGKRPDGSLIGPPMPMPSYRDMSDEDARAIVAYLRSVTPIVNRVPKSQYKIPLPPDWGPPVGSVPPVAKTDKVAYGGYLVKTLGHCLECHSPAGPNGAPDMANKPGAGGLHFKGPWGDSYSANITPTGIGKWSDDDIKKAIQTGVRPDGVRLKPPMGYHYYKNISAADMDAIVAYLRTLKPL